MNLPKGDELQDDSDYGRGGLFQQRSRMSRYINLLNRLQEIHLAGASDETLSRLVSDSLRKIHGLLLSTVALLRKRGADPVFEVFSLNPLLDSLTKKILGTTVKEIRSQVPSGSRTETIYQTGKYVEFRSVEEQAEEMSLYYPDVGRKQLTAGIKAAWLIGLRYIIVMPLVARSGIQGHVTLGGRIPFTDEEKNALFVIATRIGFFLEAREKEKKLEASERRFKTLFDHSPVPFWELDFSGLGRKITEAKAAGITDGREWSLRLEENKGDCRDLVRVKSVNEAAVRLYQADSQAHLQESPGPILCDLSIRDFPDVCRRFFEGETEFEKELANRTMKGGVLRVRHRYAILPGSEQDLSSVLLAVQDETMLRHMVEEFEWELRVNEIMSRVSESIISPLVALEDLAGLILSTCLSLTGSRFGAVCWTSPDNGETIFVANFQPEVARLSKPTRDYLAWVFPKGDPEGAALLGTAEAYIDNQGQRAPGFAVRLDRDFRNTLNVPMKSGDVMAGRLLLADRPEGFSDRILNSVRRIFGLLLVAVRRKEEAERLRQSEERYRTMVESFLLSVYIYDADGVCLFANRRGAERYGLGIDEIRGKRLAEFYTPAETEDRLVFIREALRSGRSAVREFSFAGKDFETAIAPLKDSHGAYSTALVTSLDITEQKKTRERLVQNEKMASIGQLAAGVAHEVNNVLTVIRMNVQDRLQELSSGTAPGRDDLDLFLRTLEDQTRRGAAIVENIVSFAKPGQLKKEPVDLRVLADKVLDLQYRQMTLEGIKLKRDYRSGRQTPVDAGRIEQVLVNLILNARRALKSVTDRQIAVRIYEDGEWMKVCIEDNGPGMSPEIRERLFMPFFNVPEVSGEEIRGAGLGLAVCQQIIRDHGGTIKVESGSDRGAIFIFSLPIGFEAADAGPVRVSDRISPVMKGLTGLDVVLVEDEPEINEYICRILKRNGLSGPRGFVAPLEALESVRIRRPDIVFLDLLMPDMNGEEWFVEARRLYPDLKIVFMSGQLGLEKERLTRLGADGYLQKPFDAVELLELLRSLFPGHS